MIGMGGTGSGNEDPVLAVMRVLGDPSSYAAKYEDLVKQTVAAKQATEDSIKARNDADVKLSDVAKASGDLAVQRDIFDKEAASQRAILALREADVFSRENSCNARESALAAREAALTKATAQAKASTDADRAAFQSDVIMQSGALDRRKAALDDAAAQANKKLDVRTADLAAREAATEELNRAATALKLQYEQKIAALRALTG